MKDVPVIDGMTRARFHAEIRPAAEPAIFRGLVNHWPIIQAAARGDEVLAATIAHHAEPGKCTVAYTAPEENGRFHYDESATALNFVLEKLEMAELMQRLLAERTNPRAPGIAAQGLPLPQILPQFAPAHDMPLLGVGSGAGAIPRMWICNATKVATHNDELENIACCAAGRRRFTLFPPEQIANLYMGPFELTPGGTPISMVHVTAPDLDRYPRYAEAEAAAWVAELAPGDALYIPYQWFHHVEALEPINILVNYWWNDARGDLGYGWDALLHAMIAIRQLPPDQKRAWHAAFEHYVFETGGSAAAHLPKGAQGVLAEQGPAAVKELRDALIRNLSSTTGERFGPMK